MVQGVGFRPFVAKTALQFSIAGYVKNTPNGVLIHAEGDSESVDGFFSHLSISYPPLAKISSIAQTESGYTGASGFVALPSDESGSVTAFFPPDLSICEECKKELFDPNNRRYLYPFINCQNCGPRFTVIKALAYDRAKTSMSVFEMCSECAEEYSDISSRRFKAEPVSCPNCGPTLYLYDKNKELIASSRNGDILEKTAMLLRSGAIAAIKGVGGFHLVCDALNDEAVKELRGRKKRLKKPLAVMFSDLEAIKKECSVTSDEEGLISSIERPIVLVKKSDSYSLSNLISFDSGFVGVFLPYSGLYEVLAAKLQTPLVATSANISEEPIVTDENTIFEMLGGVFDYCLTYDREILHPCDDSVVRAADGETVKIRNSRGYAPFFKSQKLPDNGAVFCAGAHQKNTFAALFRDRVYVSPHIGDLNSLGAIDRYKDGILSFAKMYDLTFTAAVCDKNPRYSSSIFAKELGVKTLTVQHHKAHFLASLYEKNALDTDAIGVVWDGTGLGDDGAVWGGEFFLKTGYEISRIGSLPQFWLMGGEGAAKEPRKSGFSLFLETYGKERAILEAERFSFSRDEAMLLAAGFDKKLGAVRTSSMGRLFDGVASICGLAQKDSFDGEAGLLLESLYNPLLNAGYDGVVNGKELSVDGIVRSVFLERDKSVAATKFINTLAYWVKSFTQGYDLPVYFSGGVFQNAALVYAIKRELRGRAGLIFHTEFSPNDSSLCLGHAGYAKLFFEGKIKENI